MKILYVTTVGGTMRFFRPFVGELIDAGHTVDVAANENYTPVPPIYEGLSYRLHHISFTRFPVSLGNLKAIFAIRRIVKNEKYELVHCHTPIAALMARLACRPLRKKGVKVIYTAHGFHFFQGSPKKNWLIYYPMEWLGSLFTDVLITITKEDYDLAKRRFRAKETVYLPGVGIDRARFVNTQVDRAAKRREIGVPEDCTMMLSVGEFNENKNQMAVIRCLAELNLPDLHYVLVGRGELKSRVEQLIRELGLDDKVHLIGYRADVNEIYAISDFYILPSLREGLNVSIMEAMTSRLPVICADIRGNRDMIRHGENGLLYRSFDHEGMKNAILKLCSDRALRSKLGKEGYDRSTIYECRDINRKLAEIYGVTISD